MMRLIGVLVLASRVLAAQQPPVTRLQPANGDLKETFRKRGLNEFLEWPRQIRELRDGRLLIFDDPRVLVGDFGTGNSAPLQEQNLAGGAVVALAGDSSFVALRDGWHFLDGTRLIGMLPSTNPLVRSIEEFSGADAQGFLLSLLPQKTLKDSATLIRVNRSSGDQEIMAKLWPGNPPIPGVFRPVCAMYERGVLMPDGWIAVVRVNPYRVDWRSPAGQWTLGAAIPTPVVSMTDKEKEVYLQWRARERPPTPDESVQSWPATVCPWVGGYRPIATPDGNLIVYRVPTTTAPATRYDVINRRGEVERQIALSESEAILGFGAKSVYVVRTEGAGQTIHRHPWP